MGNDGYGRHDSLQFDVFVQEFHAEPWKNRQNRHKMVSTVLLRASER
jgi:hypothetical protein